MATVKQASIGGAVGIAIGLIGTGVQWKWPEYKNLGLVLISLGAVVLIAAVAAAIARWSTIREYERYRPDQDRAVAPVPQTQEVNSPVNNTNTFTPQNTFSPTITINQSQPQQQEQRQSMGQTSEPPAIEPLPVKVREMYVTRYGEVTDAAETFVGEPNKKLLVAIADFRRVADRYQEASVGISTRILFYDGSVEEYRVNDGFWFKSERHRAYFSPGDTRRLVVAVFGDGFLVPYDGRFKAAEVGSVWRHKYFELDDNQLTAERLQVIIELVGVNPRNVTVLSMSARYGLVLDPAEFTLEGFD